jgi:hypothetical protein
MLFFVNPPVLVEGGSGNPEFGPVWSINVPPIELRVLPNAFIIFVLNFVLKHKLTRKFITTLIRNFLQLALLNEFVLVATVSL